MINEPAINGPADGKVEETSARELAEAIGGLAIEDLTGYQPELAAAVAELATSAGRRWLDPQDDPVVALLRVLARLAIEAPDATSGYAKNLLAMTTSPVEPQLETLNSKSQLRTKPRLSNALSPS